MRLGRLCEPLERASFQRVNHRAVSQSSSPSRPPKPYPLSPLSEIQAVSNDAVRSFDRIPPPEKSARAERRDRSKPPGPTVPERRSSREGSETETAWTDAGVIMLTNADLERTLEMFQPEQPSALAFCSTSPATSETVDVELEVIHPFTFQQRVLLALVAVLGVLIGLAYVARDYLSN